MEERNEIKRRWLSGDVVITLSSQHRDLHIVNHADNKFHAVYASNQYMRDKYPENSAGRKKKPLTFLQLKSPKS